MASATAPPTPVSISSKISVGAEPLAASTTLSASMKRASSPPEATFISGASGVPGLAATRNSTRSMPCGPGLLRHRCRSRVSKRARSSLSGGSSAITALSSVFAVSLARAHSARSAAASNLACASLGSPLQAGASICAAIADRLQSALEAFQRRGQRSTVHLYLRAARAQREQPLFGLSPVPADRR